MSKDKDEKSEKQQPSELANHNTNEPISLTPKQTVDSPVISKPAAEKSVKKQVSFVESSEEEETDRSKYTIATDFDLDGPSVDDWLNDEDENETSSKKDSGSTKVSCVSLGERRLDRPFSIFFFQTGVTD